MSKLLAFQETHSPVIPRDFPRHWRRATGYSLDQFLKEELNPAKLIVSSEGSLATTVEARARTRSTSEEDGARDTAVRRSRRSDGDNDDHPRNAAVSNRVDGPDADRTDAPAGRLRCRSSLHQGQP